jgi:Animal haem peroxidase
MSPGGISSRLASVAERVDRKRGWDSLGSLAGGITLFGLRARLRQRNLYDTAAVDPPTRRKLPARLLVRSVDGTATDVGDRMMGAAGTHFGRNGPAVVQSEWPDADEVSRELLLRREFEPATSLNLLAAAWIQFEVHDWMQHRTQKRAATATPTRAGPPLARTPASTTSSPQFVSDQTHWWDASQLYGADSEFADSLRADPDSGRVKVDDALLSAIEKSMERKPAPVPNLWVGLALFHVLFAHEHNAICDALEKHESKLKLRGDSLFDKARLINAAVMAKIHTVEWTPAVIAHPTTRHASNAIWWGVLGKRMRRLGRVGSGEVLSGIPGSRTRHDGVRYSLTEEFVAVYRMHPLIPDEVTFRRVKDDALMRLGGDTSLPFEELAVGAGPPETPRNRLTEIEYANAFYSLGIAHPGTISLHNYPRFLLELPQLSGDGGATHEPPVNLAARDIERTRECAIARYNEFRRIFRLRPVESFYELANGNEKLACEIRKVYGELKDVDLLVGLFAERKPSGFAFSDTAFRVFLLMAARRLRSDRFFTTDYTKQVYTGTGLRWIHDATLPRILARHYPELGPVLGHVENAFKPWSRAP